MTLIDVLAVCGNYNRYIQIYNMENNRKSGVMKVGNITYKQIDRYGYGVRVYQLIPCTKQGKNVLFISLCKRKAEERSE